MPTRPPRGTTYDVAVLVGPSHFAAFDGVALYPEGAFASPFGPIAVDAAVAAAIAAAGDVIRALPSVHAREHSLEMQLPFLGRLFPGLPIVPLLMGHQSRRTIEALASALAAGLASRRALLVASTDLSHYFDARDRRQARWGGRATRSPPSIPSASSTCSSATPRTSVDGYVGCGIGPAIAVMMAARALGARAARVLRYAHSGDVSGDYDGVVGYVAAAIGTFDVD